MPNSYAQDLILQATGVILALYAFVPALANLLIRIVREAKRVNATLNFKMA